MGKTLPKFPKVLYYGHTQMTYVSWREHFTEAKGMGFISAFGLLKKCSREFDVAFQILKNMEFVSI